MVADALFPGSEVLDVVVDHPHGGTAVHAVTLRQGPPLVLLHGYPQTHVRWSPVAPDLTRDHTLVVPDLRGYGDSGRPADGEGHAGHSFRAMAADVAALMRELGRETHAVVAHDRGARVTHRLTLDHPAAVTRAAVPGLPAGARHEPARGGGQAGPPPTTGPPTCSPRRCPSG